MASWLFLAVSLWGAWFSWNALRPMGAGAYRAAWSFAAGWLTSELALHHLAWQAGATLVFALFGAFSAWPGWLGLGITLISWVALGLAQVRSANAGAAVERSLRSALGGDYRDGIRPSWREGLDDGIDWRHIVVPFPLRRPVVEKIPNLRFARERGVDLQLDVYRRKDHPRDCPVLLQIHGGGWMIGDKREQALPLMYQMTERGWVCVSVNYRLSPHATFPEHLQDCKRALAWTRANIAAYGGDPDLVVVTGGSAGGHLAALLALTPNDPEYQPGFEDVDTSVVGCLPYYGIYDFTNRNATMGHDGLLDVLTRHIMKGSLEEIPEAYDRASPIARVGPHAPPFLVIHGDRDTLAPVDEARHFVEALTEKSTEPVGYAEIPGAQHAFEVFPSLRCLRVNRGAARFLEWARTRAVEARRDEIASASAKAEAGAAAGA